MNKLKTRDVLEIQIHFKKNCLFRLQDTYNNLIKLKNRYGLIIRFLRSILYFKTSSEILIQLK